MTFEAQVTLGLGRGVLARLEADRNRWTLEPEGSVSQAEVEAVAPALFQQIADRSRLPVRAMGIVYRPCTRADPDGRLWGRCGAGNGARTAVAT